MSAAPVTIDELLDALEELLKVAVWDDEFTSREEFEPVAEKAEALLKRAGRR